MRTPVSFSTIRPMGVGKWVAGLIAAPVAWSVFSVSEAVSWLLFQKLATEVPLGEAAHCAGTKYWGIVAGIALALVAFGMYHISSVVSKLGSRLGADGVSARNGTARESSATVAGRVRVASELGDNGLVASIRKAIVSSVWWGGIAGVGIYIGVSGSMVFLAHGTDDSGHMVFARMVAMFPGLLVAGGGLIMSRGRKGCLQVG